MLRNIHVHSDPIYGTTHLLPGIPANGIWVCDVLQTMLLIGYLTSPPRYQGFHLSTFWAWLRYPPAIAQLPVNNLRLRRAWSEMDPHQKTILADDFGMGFACHYLLDQHGFTDFADTRFLLKRLLASFTSLANKPNKGAGKTPDFIALDSYNRLHILECKGSQSSIEYLKSAMVKGIAQKNNLSNGALFASCMVGGLYIPLHDGKTHAELRFIDPKPNDLIKELSDKGPETITREVRRQSFAKALSTAGLLRSATAIQDGRVESRDVPFIRNLTDGELKFVGFERDHNADSWRKVVEYRSFEAESGKDDGVGSYEPAFRTSLSIEIPQRIVKFFSRIVKDDGAMPELEVDSWLEANNANSRKSYKRQITEKREPPKKDVVRRKNVYSSWSGMRQDDTLSTLTMSSGLQFTLERRAY
jgi:hypothetical protein